MKITNMDCIIKYTKRKEDYNIIVKFYNESCLIFMLKRKFIVLKGRNQKISNSNGVSTVLVNISQKMYKIAKKFWPGQLAFIFPNT
jgi:tRNA A37 threonylcarbamoyladenosine synthetase subunit TsaC/SUA5/YrdC